MFWFVQYVSTFLRGHHQVKYIYVSDKHQYLKLTYRIAFFFVPTDKCTRRVRKVKIHHVLADREIFYAYYGNTAVDLDPLPVSRALLTVVEPALFE